MSATPSGMVSDEVIEFFGTAYEKPTITPNEAAG